jgi:hypothetical protein
MRGVTLGHKVAPTFWCGDLERTGGLDHMDDPVRAGKMVDGYLLIPYRRGTLSGHHSSLANRSEDELIQLRDRRGYCLPPHA